MFARCLAHGATKLFHKNNHMLSILGIATAFADYSTSTAIQDVKNNISDVGSTIGGVVPTILVLMAALVGLGWGVRKFRQHVSGKKF